MAHSTARTVRRALFVLALATPRLAEATPTSWQGPEAFTVAPGREVMPTPSCVDASRPMPGRYIRQSRMAGYAVDACGRVVVDAGYAGPLPAAAVPASRLAIAGGATIDSMTTGYGASYSPFNGLPLLGGAGTYYLSDGQRWTSGAGTYFDVRARYLRVETSHDTLRYVLIAPTDSTIYQQTDYDSGDHSSQGTLKTTGPLVLVAKAGTTTAVLEGTALIAANDATSYGEPRFNYFTALPGAIVPFRIVYTLQNATWSTTTLDGNFSFGRGGFVDFTRPSSGPALESVEIQGPSQVPEQSTTQFVAIAHYAGGVARDVTRQAPWSFEPSSLGTAYAGGQLVTAKLNVPRAEGTLRAAFMADGILKMGEMTVTVRGDLFVNTASEWPTWQGNARHDGHVPVTLDPSRFARAWSTTISAGAQLNPVTAADGHVFCTIRSYFTTGTSFFALDARDGHVMWTQPLSAFSVNPPAAAYGNVYVQTSNNYGDTWLWAFDGPTGRSVFKVPFGSQWEHYLAPTPFDGKLYVNGGAYGGMYAFDALSGAESWYLGLPQYDDWTPAVDANFVYSYVGGGFYVARRSDGGPVFMVPDPGFNWDGYDVGISPALGGANDAFVTNSTRLICFDLGSRSIRWQAAREYRGQPSISGGVVYVNDGGRLAAVDEATGAQRWSWAPPGSALTGNLVITDGHAFASTGDRVFAVDLATHQAVWSDAVSGSLALGNGQLYVSSPTTGVLTAITVQPAAPPEVHAAAGNDTTVECAPVAGGGTPVRLDGGNSIGAGLAYSWTAGGVVFDDPHSPTPTGAFPYGTTHVVLEVSAGGATATDEVLVTVVDSQPPALTVTVSPDVIWPPDHRMVAVHATVQAVDGCDASPAVRLTSVTSSEPDDLAGSGSTEPDVQDTTIGTADVDVRVRAERSGTGPGRAYRLSYEAVDEAGNRAVACASVTVTHDQGGRATIEPDGSRLTILGAAAGGTDRLDPTSLVVRAGDRDLYRASGTATMRDVNGDGLADAIMNLVRCGTADPGVVRWVRWHAGASDYLAPLDGGTLAADDRPRGIAFVARPLANPARVSAAIRYAVPATGPVQLRIFDVNGRQVAVLRDAETQAGEHVASFRAPRASGARLYFYVCEWNGRRATGKFVLEP